MTDLPKSFGTSARRKEDRRLTTGTGRFTDDVELPGQTYEAFVRSPVAHANIAGIDVSQVADDRHQVQLSLDRQTNDAISIFWVRVRHPFDDAAQLFRQIRPPFCVNYSPTWVRCKRCQ